MKNRLLTAIVAFLCAVSLDLFASENSQVVIENGRKYQILTRKQNIGKIHDINAMGTVTVAAAKPQLVKTGARLFVENSDKEVILKANFPMHTSWKCSVISGSKNDIRRGQYVYIISQEKILLPDDTLEQEELRRKQQEEARRLEEQQQAEKKDIDTIIESKEEEIRYSESRYSQYRIGTIYSTLNFWRGTRFYNGENAGYLSAYINASPISALTIRANFMLPSGYEDKYNSGINAENFRALQSEAEYKLWNQYRGHVAAAVQYNWFFNKATVSGASRDLSFLTAKGIFFFMMYPFNLEIEYNQDFYMDSFDDTRKTAGDSYLTSRLSAHRYLSNIGATLYGAGSLGMFNQKSMDNLSTRGTDEARRGFSDLTFSLGLSKGFAGISFFVTTNYAFIFGDFQIVNQATGEKRDADLWFTMGASLGL